MSKNKRKKSDEFTEIEDPITYLPETGEAGEMAIGVGTMHYVQLDICPIDPADGILKLNGFEAIKLGKALVKAGRRLDGGR
jgi:hypothetical protein